MAQDTTFADVLDAADRLSLDEQQTLIEILRRRVADRGRQLLLKDVQEARAEFSRGEYRPASPDQIMEELAS